MAFLPLPPPWASQGWKVKIRDKERTEPPHVTLLRGTRAWRLALRTGAFLDTEPDPRELPGSMVALVQANLARLTVEWNRMYPENPVESVGGDDE